MRRRAVVCRHLVEVVEVEDMEEEVKIVEEVEAMKGVETMEVVEVVEVVEVLEAAVRGGTVSVHVSPFSVLVMCGCAHRSSCNTTRHAAPRGSPCAVTTSRSDCPSW